MNTPKQIAEMFERYMPKVVEICPEHTHPLLYYYLGVIEYSNNNFIYLAYNVPSFSNSFRMVDNSGTVAQIPFRSYKSKVTEMSTWRVEYEAESKKMTLYYKNEETGELEKVGTAKWSKDFTFYISNMFGRYNSDSTLVCYKGTVDYIFVSAMIED